MKKIFFIFVCIGNMGYADPFLHDRANYAFQKGKIEDAQQKLQHLVVDHPHNAEALYDLGVISAQKGEAEQASAYFLQAAQRAKSDAMLQEQAYFNAANTFVELGELEKAIKQYEKVLEINSANEYAQHNLEVVKQMLEQQKQEQQEQENQDKQQEQDQQKQEQNQNQNDDNQDDQQHQDSQNNQSSGGNSDEQEQDQDSQNNLTDHNSQESNDQSNKDNPDMENQEEQDNSPENQGAHDNSEQEGSEDNLGEENRDQDRQQNQPDNNQGDREDQPQDESQQNKTGNENQNSDNHTSPEQEQPSDLQNSDLEDEIQEMSAMQSDYDRAEEELSKKDPALMRMLRLIESRDKEMNKKMMEAKIKNTCAGEDGQNCW